MITTNTTSWSVAEEAFAYVSAASQATVSSLAWISRNGQTVGKAGDLDSLNYREIKLAPDGSRAAYSQVSSANENIWVLDLARNSASRLSFGSGMERSPVWSPDSAYIAYASVVPGTNRIYRRSADGSGKDELLLESKDQIYPVSWSPDGKWLLYLAGIPDRWDQYL